MTFSLNQKQTISFRNQIVFTWVVGADVDDGFGFGFETGIGFGIGTDLIKIKSIERSNEFVFSLPRC